MYKNTSKNNFYEFLFMIISTTWIFFIGVRTASMTPLLGDELVSWNINNDTSLTHALKTLATGCDGQLPLFHIITWAWINIVPQLASIAYITIDPKNEIFFRLPSVIAFCLTYIVLQRTLRNIINPYLAGGIVISALFLHNEMLAHLAEARAYGFILLFNSLIIITLIKLSEKKSYALLIALGLLQACSLYLHPFGAIFGAAALGGSLVHTILKEKRIAWEQIIFSLLGWSTFLIWVIYGGFENQTNLTQECEGWATAPPLNMLINTLNPSYTIIWIIPIIVNAVAIAMSTIKEYGNENRYGEWQVLKYDRNNSAATAKARLLLSIATFYTLTVVFMWIVSQRPLPLFFERYMLPERIAFAIFISVAVSNASSTIIKRFSLLWVAMSVVSLLIMSSKATPTNYKSEELYIDAGLGDEKFLKEDLPIACESSTLYAPRHFYFPKSKYYMLLDKESALADKGCEIIDYKMNERLVRNHPEQNIIPIDEFIKKFNKFYLLDETHSSAGRRNFSKQEYNWQEVPMVKKGYDNPITLKLYIITKK